MAKFEYTWNDGSKVSVNLPGETGFSCSHTNPSSTFKNFASQIVARANDSSNDHEVEDYCQEAYNVLTTYHQIAEDIKYTWDHKEIDCANGKGLCWVCRCKDKGAYCYMSENELEAAYYNWKPIPGSMSGYKQDILDIWQQASDKIALDTGQATNQALLDQLISSTNQQISVAAYENEIREVDVSAKKTQSIFMPLMIFLVLVGIMFYMFKK
tara:strand:+ start:680 stop:1315 length:636 start_codon:yes stop_codon:yes gene_type:complete